MDSNGLALGRSNQETLNRSTKRSLDLFELIFQNNDLISIVYVIHSLSTGQPHVPGTCFDVGFDLHGSTSSWVRMNFII